MVNPCDPAFAVVCPVGDPGYLCCDRCGSYLAYPKPTVRHLEWLEGSDEVSDLAWPTTRLLGEVLMRDSAKALLTEEPADWIPIEWHQDSSLRPSKMRLRAKRRRVWLPYEGPNLSHLWVRDWVFSDLDKSSYTMEGLCAKCGRVLRRLEGIEAVKLEWDRKAAILHRARIPREPHRGVFIHKSQLANSNLFRIAEYSGSIACTELLKERFEAAGIRNVSFLEIGETLD